jgi:hypothetical protein
MRVPIEWNARDRGALGGMIERWPIEIRGRRFKRFISLICLTFHIASWFPRSSDTALATGDPA